MICRTFTVPTPKGTYFQKLRDQKTGTVRELRVYLYTEHFRNRENGNMPSHKSKAIGVCVSVEDTFRMYPNDNYFELVDTTIPEAVLQQRRTRDGRKNAPAAGPSAKAGVQGQRSSLMQSASPAGAHSEQGMELLIACLFRRLGLAEALQTTVQGEPPSPDRCSSQEWALPVPGQHASGF